jgi:diguanylate cyclase (GGDEF)-like protein/PAS domain S-box-containing protein
VLSLRRALALLAALVVVGVAGAIASTDRMDHTGDRFRGVIALKSLENAVDRLEGVARLTAQRGDVPVPVEDVEREAAAVVAAADQLVAKDPSSAAATLATDAVSLSELVLGHVHGFEGGDQSAARIMGDSTTQRFDAIEAASDALEPRYLDDAERADRLAEVAVWVAALLVALLSGGVALRGERTRRALLNRQNEDRFRSLVQRAHDIVLVVNTGGEVFYASPATERVLGFDPGAIGRVPLTDFAHPEDVDRMASVFGELLSGGVQHTGTHLFRVRTASGGYLTLEGTATNALDDPAVGGVIVNARDVTDRLAAEDQLRDSEETHRLLFETNPQPMWVIDAETLDFLEVNPAAVEHYRYSREEFLSKKLPDVHDPAEHDALQDHRSLPRAAGSTRVSGPWRLLRGDGTLVLGEITSNRLDYAGRPASLVLVVDVTERIALQERLAHQAFHDDLTGLPNRALLRDRIEHSLASGCRDGRRVGLLFLDLDGFKVVNDSLGHAAGDELLAAVAARLQTCVRPGDSVARLGGDEFAVLLMEDRDDRAADVVAARTVEAFRAPFELSGREVVVTASIGIATGSPMEATADTLLRDADAAMYAAKWSGAARAERFEPTMHVAALERLELSADLRLALARDELVVHYQPVVALGTGAVEGVEALVRWQHPTRGLVPPVRFIPLAEELGLIIPIGRWVLDQACRQAARWMEAGVLARDVSVCVNVSARQLHDEALTQHVADALAVSGLDPTALVLEITETALVQDVEVAALRLAALKALGVRVAIDDFGAGYSSLDYLRRFPVDVLKIDKSFVDGVATGQQGRALVQAIVDLGTSLRMVLVAEGIEEEEQLAVLQAAGCGSGQGFLFARPADAEAIEASLTAGLGARA